MRNSRVWLLSLLVVTLPAPSPAATTLPAGFTETSVVTSGISRATSMAFTPDGRLLVCEQTGALRVITAAGVLLPTPFVTVTTVPLPQNERGLIGIAVDPNFASNQYIYLYYTATTPTNHNRVSRFTASGNVAAPGSEVILLELNDSNGTNHNGGGMKFALDGKLMIAVGERTVASNAQTLSNLLGKMLRMNADGSIPTDNPFYNTAAGENRLIYAYGLRNPYTFDVQPGTGRIYVNDVGQVAWEEVNEILPGQNYGWPTTEGDFSQGSFPTFRRPIYTYPYNNMTSCTVIGAAFYNPTTPTFPAAYAGRYFFADLCGNRIDTLDPANNNAFASFATGTSPTITDLETAASGALYYVTYNGVVNRIDYRTLSVDDPSVRESESTTLMGFTASLSVAAATDVTVTCTTSDGTAVAGSDYASTSTTVTIPAGTLSRTFVVPVLGDGLTEANETFTVTLSNPPAGVTLAKATGTATILNDDPAAPAATQAMYRLHHPATSRHLYTSDFGEYSVLPGAGWTQEGIAYTLWTNSGTYNGASGVPFFRLYRPSALQHHWTADPVEALTLSRGVWNYEGITGYVLPASASGTRPLYRLSYPNPLLHLWTPDPVEYAALPGQGWTQQGIVGHVLP